MSRTRLIPIVGLALSVVSIWLVLQSIDLGAIPPILGRAALLPAAIALGVIGAQLVVRAVRWSVLLPGHISAGRLVAPLLIGYLGNAILPARLGEPMRAVLVARRERIDTVRSLGIVLVERVLDVATLAVVVSIAAVLAGAPAWMVQGTMIGALIGVTIIAIVITTGARPVLGIASALGLTRWPAIVSVAARLTTALGGRGMRRSVAGAVILSAVAWILDAAVFWLVGQALQLELSYQAAMLISGITVLGTAIPSAPGYVGTYELAATTVAIALGVSPEAALALALVTHAITVLPLALAGAAAAAAGSSRVSPATADVGPEPSSAAARPG